MLWVDRYRPRSFDGFVVHKELGGKLKQLANEGDIPHTLFYGAPGSGKKTITMAFLRELFGSGAERLRAENKAWKVQQGDRNINIEVKVLSSNCHVEVNASDAGVRDRHVVGEMVKDIARNRPMDCHGKSFKVLVLNEVDKLSKEAQHALRRTMERYSASCRILLVCNSFSKVIDAVRSRCMAVRVPAAGEEDIRDLILPHIARSENLEIPVELAARIAAKADRNMRRAILMMEACKAQQYPFSADQQVQLPDWELYLQQIASEMFSEQTPKRLYQIRSRMYELLTNCIPPEVILKTLTNELMKKVDSDMKHELCHSAAFFEERLHQGSKPIFHLEAFCASFMSNYKQFLSAMFDD